MDINESVVERIVNKKLRWNGHFRGIAPDEWPKRVQQWVPSQNKKKRLSSTDVGGSKLFNKGIAE